MKQFAVIGLGRFGVSVAATLRSQGHEVLAIDNDEDNVQIVQTENLVTQAVCLDSTNIHALEELGLQGFDGVVLAIGEDLQASILTALNLMEMGVKRLIAKASNANHGKILERMNVPKVVYPERDMGNRVAHMLMQSSILESFQLDPRFSVMEIMAPSACINKNLAELNLRVKYSISVVAIKHMGAELAVIPGPDHVIQKNDLLVIIGSNEGIGKFIQNR
ncbi:potassium uptake system protein [bacterium (Candidatus Blackallbacteria) CG17_big_fil_post_rev_8_21_14_2_50_48_46]|uniref:Potassium uptake system protein n=1 Tax=bacterium (Candidatus Blackallbacteria) CG17_big_fil_post_rev_8_21_14_2_50_48_46 TaxID=2014261 RepID=A0A2M7GB24_9BACT|nr:MAG: potassium uptake system protein [bacterium (Candidatus Blackallbacteria) CG18_big_fil_WC_8_21_14_2_50_49_26]PIW19371.1 MAG: potassium uptake system protein [bacterium (Candidatus Blackallbacteria) CG17_big_fil_post_rev_8_21_14_2_50_48_46]PIW49025.1 MAG: potassium uptake system protein [bacterium (Candidatus Blackallbacteria) CG13_big_fil_rev_8_21_14_2_50_49_14]